VQTHCLAGVLVALLSLSVGWAQPTPDQSAEAKKAAARPRLPFTSAVRVGDTHYLAGLGSRDPKIGGHPEGFEAQVRQLMLNLQALLKRNELDFGHVVNANAYITYPGRFDEFHRIYKEYFPGVPPALTTIGVRKLPATEVELTFVASHRDGRQAIQLSGATGAKYFSAGTRDGDFVYVSGADGRDVRTGQTRAKDFGEYARHTLENAGAVLKAAGMGYGDVVKTEVYLADLKNVAAFEAVYGVFFPDAPPARTLVGVRELPKGAPLLVNLVAARGKTVITPKGVRASAGSSPAIRVGDRLFLSGGLATKPGSVDAQVREVMDDLGRILQGAGVNFSNVVDGKVYVANMEDYAAMNAAYGSYFDTLFAARSCIETGALPGASKIEITLTADASPRR
jgi:enamine deaminase RidA (YjgF/YER057c/UK114 family)